MKKILLYSTVIGMAAVLTIVATAHAKKNITNELSGAQALLAKGEYESAYEKYLYFAQEKQNSLAQFTMGLFYRLGWGRPVDDAKACEWFEKAGNQGIPTATHFFGDCLRDGTGRAPDPARAAQWYEKAAALGYHISLCDLAQLYMTGTGVPKDPEKALALCRKAAEKRVLPAQIRMGHFYMDPDSPVHDYASAFQWFSNAAGMGAPEAQYQLGIMFQDGLGNPPDNYAARIWFEKAAAQGYQPAYFPAGKLYFSSPKDPETNMLPAENLAKSYLWLSAAARQQSDGTGQKKAQALLKSVLKIMPETWKKNLDAKIAAHFKSYPADKP